MRSAGYRAEEALLQELQERDQIVPAKALVRLRAGALYELGQTFRRILQSLPK